MAIGSRSSGREAVHPAWTQWLIPSIGDLIFVVLLGLLVYSALSVRLLGDAGIGWHIRAGQLILATHAIPRVDPFSSSMAGQPWFAWEWLYDMLVGWLDSAAGLNAVVLFTALVIALTFAWTFRLLLRRGTNFLLALLLVLLAASAAMIHFLARPHVVSWLLTIVWFVILQPSEKEQCSSHAQFRQHRWQLWLLPPVMVLWLNVHGSFLIGFVLLAIYWVSAFSEYFWHNGHRFEDAIRKIRAGRRARDLALVGMVTALATLANPYGWNLHVHIYRYLSNRFLMDHIDEFQSPNFHGVAQKCFAVLLMLTFVALAERRREAGRIQLSEALLVLFAAYSGLYASRNIPVSALLLILVIGPWLSNALQTVLQTFAARRVASESRIFASPPFVQRMQAIESSLQGHLWPIAAILLTCWIVFHGGSLGSKTLVQAHFDAKRFPAAAVDYLEQRNPGSPAFAPDSWGGYLIYRLYSQTKVVVDDRHDFYGEAFLKSYLKTVRVEPGWEGFLRQHPPQWIVVPKDSALTSLLAETSAWKRIYGDDVAVVFVPALTPMDKDSSTPMRGSRSGQ
jgi:hypothetical protein